MRANCVSALVASSLLLVSLLCVAAPAAAGDTLTGYRATSPSTILFDASKDHLSFYFRQPGSTSSSPAGRPVLLTFSPFSTVQEVLSHASFLAAVSSSSSSSDLVSATACSLSNPDESPIEAHTPFAFIHAKFLSGGKPTLTSPPPLSPSLRCGSARYELVAVVPEVYHPPLNLEDMKNPETLIKAKRAYESRMAVKQQYPFTGDQITGIQIETALGWLWAFVTNHWGTLHPFQTYTAPDTGIYDMATGQQLQYTGQRVAGHSGALKASPTLVTIAADWGSGTQESDYVAATMMANNPQYTIHVGDVYYVGTIGEVQSNALGIPPANAVQGVLWPHGSVGSFALNGNHETYSRCYGYFDYWLPTLGTVNSTGQLGGQKASYFMLENEHWRLIALDTGYNTYSPLLSSDNNTQPDPVIDWLQNVVNIGNESDTRGIIFLSHHQYRSAFDKPYLATPEQLAKLVPANRTLLWLWGHEHRLAFYNLGNSSGLPLNVYGRCLGVGGFPVSIGSIPPNARTAGLVAYDDRPYTVLPGIFNMTVGFNGFSELSFDDNTLTISYRSLEVDSNGILSNTSSTLLVQETFVVDAGGNVELLMFDVVDSNITVVQNI